MGRLQGKVAVITGGSAGIGLATARLFVAEGAEVFIAGRDQARLDRAVADIGSNVTGVRCDASRAEDLDRLYDIVGGDQGRIDVLFASAGRGDLMAPIGKIEDAQYEAIFGLNVRGTLFTVQKALPLFADGGSIVLNGSMVTRKAFPESSVYSASKAAVRSFARCWSVDLKERRIRVNVVSPGSIETEVVAGMPQRAIDYFTRLIPRGSFGRTEEVAAAVLFLASDEASFITGVELAVDGGVTQI